MSTSLPQRSPRVCVIGAGPCGLATVKNLLAAGIRDIVCFEEYERVGGNWAFTDDPHRMSVYESAHLISSRALSEFEDFPMPADFPDYPSQRQMRAYFESYAAHFGVLAHVRLNTRVERAVRRDDGLWSVQATHGGATQEETFDALIVCSGHHRDPMVPEYPGQFTGEALHSHAYKRPEPFRGKRVLVVGAGNSACDIAVDIGRVAERVVISIRHGCYIVPKVIFGRPVDVLYARCRKFPRFLLPTMFALTARLVVGPWKKYGLPTPEHGPFEMHPTLNTNFLSAVRDGNVVVHPGIERFDGASVHFKDGSTEDFDTIVWGTGFRTTMPFLDAGIIDWDTTKRPPLYLKMMHRGIANLYFVGLFQPLGCIWRLADHQARIAALQIAGKLARPADIAARIDREMRSPHWNYEDRPRHAIEVDYHDFRAELLTELRAAKRAA